MKDIYITIELLNTTEKIPEVRKRLSDILCWWETEDITTDIDENEYEEEIE